MAHLLEDGGMTKRCFKNSGQLNLSHSVCLDHGVGNVYIVHLDKIVGKGVKAAVSLRWEHSCYRIFTKFNLQASLLCS